MRKKVKRALALLFAVVFLLMQGSGSQLYVSAEEPVPVEEVTSEKKAEKTVNEMSELLDETAEDQNEKESEEQPEKEPVQEPVEETEQEAIGEPDEEVADETIEEPQEEAPEESREELQEENTEPAKKETLTFTLSSTAAETYEMQITKSFVSKEGSVSVNPPEDLDHIDLLIRQYYVDEKGTRVYVGGEELPDFSGTETYENAFCVTLKKNMDAEGTVGYGGTMYGVEFYTQFEVMDERMCRDNAHTPVKHADDWMMDVDSFTYNRHYENAVVDVTNRTTPNSTVEFRGLPGTGFVLIKGTSNCGFSEGAMWYLCMPSIPDDPAIQNVIINAICEKAGGEGGLSPSKVVVKNSDQIAANKGNISIDFLDNGTIDLIFTGGTKTWSMFCSGDFNFSGVNITGEITNRLSRTVLRVSKTVEGNLGDRDHEAFSFYLKVSMDGVPYTEPLTMRVNEESASVGYGTVSFDPSDSGYEFSLAHGQEAEFTVPYGAVCEVVEKDYSAEGYRTGISNNGVQVLQNEMIRVVNTRNLAPPTGIFQDTLPYVLMMLVPFLCSVLWGYCSKKKPGGSGT